MLAKWAGGVVPGLPCGKRRAFGGAGRNLSCDPARVGVRIGGGPAGLAKVREMRRERFSHPQLDLFACLAEGEHTVHVRAVRAPGAVLVLFVDD